MNMQNVKLALGYYAERPYGRFAETSEGKASRPKQLDFQRKLFGFLDKEGAPRTVFILGDFLEKCLYDFRRKDLRELYDKDNRLNDIQQHSYSHAAFRPIRGENARVVTVEEYLADLEKANHVIEGVLSVKSVGLGTPYGYHHDLSDVPELLEGLGRMGFLYVSSDLRRESSLDAPLTGERQPHTYGNVGISHIVEIPSHGWQDAVFTAEKSQRILGRKPDDAETILRHYAGLLGKAAGMAEDDKTVYVALCLHPWAIMEYDPDLKIHRKLIGEARERRIEIVSYKKIAEETVRA